MKNKLHTSLKTLQSSLITASVFGLFFASSVFSLQANAASSPNPVTNPATSYNYIYYITGNNADDNYLLIKKNKATVAKTHNDLIKEQEKSRLVQAPTRNTTTLGSPSERLARSTPLQPALSYPASVRPAGR